MNNSEDLSNTAGGCLTVLFLLFLMSALLATGAAILKWGMQ